MFDVSLIELAVIALVALLVLGPEKLPRAARTIGLYVRKAKQSWYSVRADIERELAADELKRSLKQTQDTVRSATTSASRALAAATSLDAPAAAGSAASESVSATADAATQDTLHSGAMPTAPSPPSPGAPGSSSP
jgi:sec-independent protein translocase protein TatB